MVFCCKDDAAAAETPRDLKEKEEKRRKAEENTVDGDIAQRVSEVSGVGCL